MIYLLWFTMMCHLVVVSITTVWGLKEFIYLLLISSLFTRETCCCFADSRTFLPLKLFYCWSQGVKSATWDQDHWFCQTTLMCRGICAMTLVPVGGANV